MKKFAKEYFTFTKKERVGIYSLLFIILVCIIAPFLFTFFIREKKYDPAEFKKAISELKIIEDSNAVSPSHYQKYPTRNYSRPSTITSEPTHLASELFDFDPNTLSAEGWQRLGIREKTALTIQKYVAKGGHFYKPEDISKIWGLQPEQAKQLIPFVHIAEVAKASSNNYHTSFNNIKNQK